MTDAEVHAMIDSLGDVAAALAGAQRDRLADIYAALDLQVRYDPAGRAADVTIRPASRGE